MGVMFFICRKNSVVSKRTLSTTSYIFKFQEIFLKTKLTMKEMWKTIIRNRDLDNLIVEHLPGEQESTGSNHFQNSTGHMCPSQFYYEL